MDNPRSDAQVLEGNILAMIDSSGVRDARDVHDDRLSFLEAVRTASLVSSSPSRPTWKMYDAIFCILRASQSLELAMGSFQLLTDLDKCYPRVYLSSPDSFGTNSDGGGDLMLNKEAWYPFTLGSESSYNVAAGLCRGSKQLIDPESLSILVEEIALGRHLGIKLVENMLLFQYLVHVFEADFLLRHSSYRKIQNWAFLRESLLSLVLASRKMNYKCFICNCMSITSKSFFNGTNFYLKDEKDTKSISADLPQSCNAGLPFAISEFQRTTCDAVQKLLIMVMEFDEFRKDAGKLGLTSRSDGFRVPILDTILDELTYNKDHLSPFLEVFGDPKWKLEIILLYFGKYYSMPSTRSRRTENSPNDKTLQGILNCFSNPTISRGILRKVTSKAARLLLAQAFKCYLSLQHDQKNAIFATQIIGGSTLLQICRSVINSFKNLQKLDESLELTSFEGEALFIARTLSLSTPP